jgi:hypothetical protein
MKSANAKVHELLEKLQRLADPANGGTKGEIDVANKKIARLKARFDFSGPAPDNTMDIFAELKVKRTRRAAHVHTFESTDLEIANAVKWAIETATGANCLFRGTELLAEVTTSTAKKLAKTALHISQSFQELLGRFCRLEGVKTSDRSLFVRGLYDGMMNDGRGRGEPLPTAPAPRRRAPKSRKSTGAAAPELAVHPYTLAYGLGRQIRFAAPLEELTAELNRITQAALARGTVAG